MRDWLTEYFHKRRADITASMCRHNDYRSVTHPWENSTFTWIVSNFVDAPAPAVSEGNDSLRFFLNKGGVQTSQLACVFMMTRGLYLEKHHLHLPESYPFSSTRQQYPGLTTERGWLTEYFHRRGGAQTPLLACVVTMSTGLCLAPPASGNFSVQVEGPVNNDS